MHIAELCIFIISGLMQCVLIRKNKQTNKILNLNLKKKPVHIALIIKINKNKSKNQIECKLNSFKHDIDR